VGAFIGGGVVSAATIGEEVGVPTGATVVGAAVVGAREGGVGVVGKDAPFKGISDGTSEAERENLAGDGAQLGILEGVSEGVSETLAVGVAEGLAEGDAEGTYEG
jgi:hypothetical protein